MGKKKLSLKPVQRGFATTSVASKKPELPAVDSPPPPDHPNDQTNGDVTGQDPVESVKPDWDDGESIEQAELQGYVDRLQEKGDKEVSRILKGIEYDKRLSHSFPRLEINRKIRDQVLALALEEDGETNADGAPAREGDDALLRLYVTYHTLLRLGFSETRIEQFFAVTGEVDWDAGLRWMWLHLSEDECLCQGQYAPRSETLPSSDEPLEDVPLAEPHAEPPEPPSRPVTCTTSSTPTQTSLFQSLDASEDDSGSDPDLDRINTTWAELMLELDSLRGGGVRKKKSKASGVVLETPQMRALKDQLAKLEKEYMFNRKDADALFKTLKSRRGAEALKMRLEGRDEEEEVDPTPDESDQDEGIFGNMLELAITTEETSSTIQVRSMPIPKQFAFAGNTPKSLLALHLTKVSKSAVVAYARLSGHSRAARAGVEVRWSPTRRRVWRMEEVACDDLNEAENFVATLALSDLYASGEISGVNWKSMPMAFRELWEELEREQKTRDDQTKRATWKKLKAFKTRKAKLEKTDAAGRDRPPREVLPVTLDRAPKESLRADFERRTSSASYRRMRPQRDSLPIAAYREEIVSTLEKSQVMVLSGETGCGKSTQLPSFILEDQLARGQPCKIFVTEPRRISAISLAQRVSQELGDAPGAVGSTTSLVGYSIRLEAKLSASTRLAFVTNGIALRMLESGSAFDEITHIIVDEVHERSIESDFLLIVLKSLVVQRPDLKVVLMSATLDADKLSAFFGGCPCLTVPGRTFPVQVNYLEDAVELSGWHIDESSPYAIRARNYRPGKQLEWEEDAEDSGSDEDPAKLSSAKYSPRTVSTVNLLDSRQIPYELVVRLLEVVTLERVDLQAYSQAVLVFLPGLAEIRKLVDILGGHPDFGTAAFVIYPLHSTISSEGQSAVFDLPPQGVRKIVISTNIAETGVTIPDVTCVIDAGKHREMRYDEKRQISRLVETYIARSNAKQRRGRAGRVQEGLAFHLFTRARQLAEHPLPEMLRLSLQDLALRIKILRIKLGPTIESVLGQAMDPPTSLNIQRAIAALVEVGALTTSEDITPMGRLLSKLPIDVHLGKFLLVAAMFKCLDPALTIAATLNAKSPFVSPFGLEQAAETAKRGFATGNSDFLTVVNVFDSFRRASDNPGFVRTWCKRNFVSLQNLQQIEELRQQLLAYLVDSSFIQVSGEEKRSIGQARGKTRFSAVPTLLNVNAAKPQLISAALAAGLYPKLISLDGGLRTIINQQPVSIHPSSVNFRLPMTEFGTNYLCYFTIMHSKRLYAWEVSPVEDRALAMLCGDQADVKLASNCISLDRKVRFKVEPKTALAVQLLRQNFTETMAARLRGRVITEKENEWFELGLRALDAGVYEDDAVVGVAAS